MGARHKQELKAISSVPPSTKLKKFPWLKAYTFMHGWKFHDIQLL